MLFLISCLCIIFLLARFLGHIYYYQRLQNLKNLQISPANTIITFDIHGVLFAPDSKKIKQLIKTNKSILKVLVYLLWPPFILDILKLVHQKVVPEEIIKYLCSRYKGIAPYQKYAIGLANAQKPIPHMSTIVSELKNKGYQLHVFSNIGSEIFKELSAEHKEFFAQFDTIYIPHEANHFIGKPRHQAFHDYLKRCNPLNQQIIFIDNRWRNIKAAHACQIFGIHFKSAKQLLKQLEQLAIIKKTIANVA